MGYVMKGLLKSILIMSMLGAAAARAEMPLQEVQWARKASLHLRGTVPSIQEWDQWDQLWATNRSDFRSRVTREMMATPEFSYRFFQYYWELFRFLRGQDYGPLLNNPEIVSSSALGELLVRTFRENDSLKNLLTGELRRVPGPSEENVIQEEDEFYRWEQRAARQGWERLSIPRGVLNSREFFDRYKFNATNPGFRRSAAMFRIFLCREMRPALLLNENAELLRLEALGRLTLDRENSVDRRGGPSDSRPANTPNRHASDPSCQACHIELDG